MSGFLKGIFGTNTEDGEEVLANGQSVESGEPDEFTADVHGTVETELSGEISASGSNDGYEDDSEDDDLDRGYADGASLLVQGSPPPLKQKEFSTSLVWEQSKVNEQEQVNVEKAQQLLRSLPDETPADVKRQIVEASLKAFEVSIDDITSAASNEISALRDYIDEVNDRARDFTAESEHRIEELESEIERIRDTITTAEEERLRLVGEATEVIEDVEPVMEFFTPNGTASGVISSGPGFTVSSSVDDDEEPVDAVAEA